MSDFWKDKLYTYGFLLTTNDNIVDKKIGVNWNKWNYNKIENFHLYTHPTQKVYSFSCNNTYFLLIGHAYNPFTMEHDENDIIQHLSNLYKSDYCAYRDYFDQLTGLFFYAVIENGTITATSDCAGILSTYYAKIDKHLYFSSYSQLIADLCSLQESTYVKDLKKSKLFKLYGWFLPGNLTPYDDVFRVIPNTEVCYNGSFNCNRFYPRSNYIIDEENYDDNIKSISSIIHNNLSLVKKKWNNPAISLTGGMDSQTTLSCTGDLQKDFKYFSYISLDREATDANAAHSICESKHLNHKIFNIQTDKTQLDEFDEVDALLERHYSYMGKANENDVCKRISLSKVVDFDIEVKSWVLEVARASRYKMYNKKKMPKNMTPRRLTTMYKVFAFNRKSALETDKKFKAYIEETNLKSAIEANNYPWSEFFVWEIVFGGWGGICLTGEQRLTNDITIPYNNRALLDMMLRTPLNKRITDQINKDIINYMDPKLSDLGVHIINGNSTKLREFAEKMYFEVHSRLPF